MSTVADKTFWVAGGMRPPGQPGTAWAGEVRDSWLWPEERVKLGLSYPAILDAEGEELWLWRDGQWISSPGYRDHFTPDEEWKASCDHLHALPYQTCSFESDCLSLRREEAKVS